MRRVDIRAILANPEKRRLMTAGAIRFIQQIEGREISMARALEVYDKVHVSGRRVKLG